MIYIKGNYAYKDKEYKMLIGQLAYQQCDNGFPVIGISLFTDIKNCIFCYCSLSDANRGYIEISGIDKLDRNKLEKTNESDQLINGICSKCVLDIYRIIFGSFKDSKSTEREVNKRRINGLQKTKRKRS